MKAHEISIKALVDVVAVLSNDTLQGNVHLMDTNKLNGSINEGTLVLETAVKEGDELIWSTFGLETESYVEISDITVNFEFLNKPIRKVYDGTNISYWESKVIKTPTGKIPYSIRFCVGSSGAIFSTIKGPSIKPINI
jgi:hypothetical protein